MMKLERKSDTHIIVNGVVKTFSETQELKDFIDSMTTNNDILTLEFIDAYSLASSIIGYLNKKIYEDGIKISVEVHQDELFELMDMLSLVATLNVKKVS